MYYIPAVVLMISNTITDKRRILLSYGQLYCSLHFNEHFSLILIQLCIFEHFFISTTLSCCDRVILLFISFSARCGRDRMVV
jgi:hypothetical protein